MGNSYDRPQPLRFVSKVILSDTSDLGNSLVVSKPMIARGTYLKGDDRVACSRNKVRSIQSFMNDADMEHPRFSSTLLLPSHRDVKKTTGDQSDESKEMILPRYDWERCFREYHARAHIKRTRCNLITQADLTSALGKGAQCRFIAARDIYKSEPLTRRYELRTWIRLFWIELHNAVSFRLQHHTSLVGGDIDSCSAIGQEAWIPVGPRRDVECLEFVRCVCAVLPDDQVDQFTPADNDAQEYTHRLHGDFALRFKAAVGVVRGSSRVSNVDDKT